MCGNLTFDFDYLLNVAVKYGQITETLAKTQAPK